MLCCIFIINQNKITKIITTKTNNTGKQEHFCMHSDYIDDAADMHASASPRTHVHAPACTRTHITHNFKFICILSWYFDGTCLPIL